MREPNLSDHSEIGRSSKHRAPSEDCTYDVRAKALACRRGAMTMRKALLAFVMMAVVAAASPASAVDDGFQGLYRVTQRDVPGTCHSGPDRVETHRIWVRFINDEVRDYGRSGRYSRRHLEYVSGRYFPWRNERDVKLRYRPRTDTAVGVNRGLEGCRSRVRLVPIG